MLVLIYPQVQLRGDMGVLMSQALSQRSGDSLGDLGTACQGMLQVQNQHSAVCLPACSLFASQQAAWGCLQSLYAHDVPHTWVICVCVDE